MRIMLKASYKRQERYRGQEPELISAEYGEIPDEIVLGETGMALAHVAREKGTPEGIEMGDIIERAVRAACRVGKMRLLR